MLELNNLTITQGDFILRADFKIARGARVAVIGPSGSGKSTLLGAIGGFLTPTEGNICFDGQDLTHIPSGKRPVSVLFQDQNLFPHLTVKQNVGLGIRPDLKLTAAQNAQIDEALSRVGLADMGGRRPANLSGGQQSRVALARVLLRARPVLLLDEPFAALGPALKAEMLDLLSGIVDHAATTVLLVTHDPDDARQFAPETIFIDNNRANPPVSTDEILQNPPPGLRSYLG